MPYPLSYAVRTRMLSPGLRPTRPLVHDVVCEPSGHVMPYGVHTDRGRAQAHADRLNRQQAEGTR